MGRVIAIAILAFLPGSAAIAPAGTTATPAWELVFVTLRADEYSLVGPGRIMLATSGGEPRELARGTHPEWSPDGRRIAFASPRGGIEVMRADGSGRRRLTEVGFGQPAWSPDGRRLAFSARGGMAVIEVAGGAARVLSSGRVADPAWSSDGRRLAFVTHEQGDADIAVIDADGSGKIVFADPPVAQPAYDTWVEERPRWSPDGRELAFTRRYAGSGHPPRFGTLWRSDADGGGATEIVRNSCCAEWSATGLRLLHVQETWAPCYRVCEDEEPGEIAVVGRDGKGSRLLTGPDALPDAEPRWMTGERHILFLSARDTRRNYDSVPSQFSTRVTNAYLMNGDGTCPTRLTNATPARTVVHARLRPGASTRWLHCADLEVAIYGKVRLALATSFTTSLRVRNTGDLAAGPSTVVVASRVASLRSVSGPDARCRVLPKLVRCELPRIPAGGSRTLIVGWRSTKGPNFLYAEARVVGSTPEGDLANNIDFHEYEVTSCTHLGTDAAETLRGTAGVDRICAGGGDDRIAGLGGNDAVDGGTGDDEIDAGPGRDSIRGNWGNDTILARDGERDIVSCGLDADQVVADGIDVIREDCERVELP
jgi:dipeptidyl aminopeptidase/acylaminoacyl peptidase